jgi:DNA segregation ATPase FtsK/SpoIIIE-like protein
MSSTFAIPDVNQQLARFSESDEAIATLADKYLPLKINGINDAAGFKAVHEARMDIRARRVQVEKVRKDLKADALDYGRKVDSEAKRITSLLEPIESHLAKEEAAVNEEKDRIRNAARLKAEAEERARAEAEAARIKAEHDAEVERLRIEREKLDSERREMDAERLRIETEAREKAEAEAERLRVERAKMDAERRAIEAEKRKLEEAESARIREIEMKKREAEAAERARIATEEKIAREAAEAKAQAEAEEVERKRVEALRPDREKLLAVADAVEAITIPTVSHEARHVAAEVADYLGIMVQDIRHTINTKLGEN